MNALVDIFQPNLYPSSGSGSQSSSNSFSTSTSRTGLPSKYQKNILDTAVPKLQSSINNYETNVDNATKAAQEMFQSQTRNAVSDNLQGILNRLAGRNMISSSVASDTLGRSLADVILAGANKGYETQMTNAGLKAQLPEMLKNIVSLGQESTGSSRSDSTQNSVQSSFQSNPLAPYELLAQYDWNMS